MVNEDQAWDCVKWRELVAADAIVSYAARTEQD